MGTAVDHAFLLLAGLQTERRGDYAAAAGQPLGRISIGGRASVPSYSDAT